MSITRRNFVSATAGSLALGALGARSLFAQDGVTLWVRYARDGDAYFGRLEGDMIHPIRGNLFGPRRPGGRPVKASDVKLLYPVEPPKVLAVGLNYASHIGNRPKPPRPEIFYKPITCLQNPGDPIVIPEGSKDLHYEAELVVVIGRRASKVSEADAPNYIFGYTCGNDVSERNWQNGSIDKTPDLQWWRGKGADTFGPLGPAIATGIDISAQDIQSRLNGEVKQKQKLSDLIFGPAAIVSFVSQYVTLQQGDVIYTGTPGSTSPMKDGDVIEIEISGIGVLRNPVKKA